MSGPSDAEIERVLAEFVGRASRRPAGEFGVFLHGSRQFGQARPDSDIDVLVLSDPAEPAEAAALRKECGSLTGPGGVLLDLKVVPADVFGAAPWVPLSRARFLGGHDWRTDLGEPVFDAAARESINVFAAMVGYGDFDQPDPSRVVKPLRRLCSVLVILGLQVAPASGGEAVEALVDSERLTEPIRHLASTALDLLDRVEEATPPMAVGLRQAITHLVDEVIASVEAKLAADGFGPRCQEAALRVLAAREGLWPPKA